MFQIMIYPVLSITDVEKDDIAMPSPQSYNNNNGNNNIPVIGRSICCANFKCNLFFGSIYITNTPLCLLIGQIVKLEKLVLA